MGTGGGAAHAGRMSMMRAGNCGVTPMQQLSVQVFPTQTHYTFQQGGVQLDLWFSTPAFVNQPQSLALPFTYLTYHVSSIDGNAHTVSLYYDNTAEQAVTDVDESVTWNVYPLTNGGLTMNFGTVAQDIFGQQTDMIDCACMLQCGGADPRRGIPVHGGDHRPGRDHHHRRLGGRPRRLCQ